ncbi:MAG: retention module-containing protein, partial [Polaromonas sp.]|nr:retention module-containing protein [Polaromonas sp.]
MANEAKVIGNVVLVEGVAFAQNKEGVQRQLSFGDPVFEGEVVVTAVGGRVELAFDQGGKFLLRSKETVTLDSTVFDNILPDGNSGALLSRVGELTSILNAISEGSGLDRLLQETSSGVASSVGGGVTTIRPDDGNSFVRLVRTVEALAPLTYEYTSLERNSVEYSPTSDGRSANSAGVFVPDANAFLVGRGPLEDLSTLTSASTSASASTSTSTSVQTSTSTLTVRLSATPTLSEAGGSIVYTATVTQAPTSALAVTLSNGSTISIGAGQLSGSTSVVVASSEDVYVDPSSISATIASTSGGGIAISIDPTAATTSITDTIDTTTVSLTGSASVTEGGTATYTVSLTAPAQTTAVTVNLTYSGTATDGSDFTGV